MLFQYLNIVQIIFILSFIFQPFSWYAAADDLMPDYPHVNKPFIQNTVLLNIDYFSDVQYKGLTGTSPNQPELATGITYYSNRSFDASIQSVIAWNSDTGYRKAAYEYDFTAGYSFLLSRNFTIRPSYSHTEYSRNSNLFATAFSEILQTDVYYFSEYYLAGASLSYLLGKKNMFFFTLQNGVFFNFNRVIGKNTMFSIQIEADMNVNDKNYYNSFIYDAWNAEEFTFWVNDQYPEYSQQIINDIRLYGLPFAKNRLVNNLESDNQHIFEPSYGVTSIQILAPVMFMLSRYTLSVTPMFSIPCYSSDFYSQFSSFIITAGISISFNP